MACGKLPVCERVPERDSSPAEDSTSQPSSSSSDDRTGVAETGPIKSAMAKAKVRHLSRTCRK